MGVVKNRAIPFGLKNGMAYFTVLFAIKTESNKHQITKTSAVFFFNQKKLTLKAQTNC